MGGAVGGLGGFQNVFKTVLGAINPIVPAVMSVVENLAGMFKGAQGGQQAGAREVAAQAAKAGANQVAAKADQQRAADLLRTQGPTNPMERVRQAQDALRTEIAQTQGLLRRIDAGAAGPEAPNAEMRAKMDAAQAEGQQGLAEAERQLAELRALAEAPQPALAK